MSGPAQNIHNIYDPLWEHDACGIGAVVNLKGTPSHATVDSALKIVEKLEHRAGKDATGETGDGFWDDGGHARGRASVRRNVTAPGFSGTDQTDCATAFRAAAFRS